MYSVLDHDDDDDAPTPPYPMTELLRTYLEQSRSFTLGRLSSPRREQPRVERTDRAQDLWDYLGDFA